MLNVVGRLIIGVINTYGESLKCILNHNIHIPELAYSKTDSQQNKISAMNERLLYCHTKVVVSFHKIFLR